LTHVIENGYKTGRNNSIILNVVFKIQENGTRIFADQADEYGFFYYLDLIPIAIGRIKLQQVGVDQERQINSNLLELKSAFKSAKSA
jgi:hypothetical protein